MKRIVFAALVPLMMAAVGFGQGVAPVDPRFRMPLMTEWSFHKGALEAAAATGAAPAAEVNWEKVTLPHTWNAQDGQDGGGNYFRGDGWYRRTVTITPEMMPRGTTGSKRFYLRFEGANRRSEVFFNGVSVGKHTGGTQAFVVDVTSTIKQGDNALAVHVDNKADADSAPLQADFTFFGGIYRPVELFMTDQLHIAVDDYASPGLYLTTPAVTDAGATISVRALVQNDGEGQRPANVWFRIFDAKNELVASANQRVTVAGHRTEPVTITTRLLQPHLWNGRADPYLYTARVSVVDNADPLRAGVVDAVSQPLGIRTFAIDPEKGFMLNGKPYPLHGVNRHQDRLDKGWAISNEDHAQDMALIKEMGCTAIRLAHYQHAEYFYQLCDREGMVVWAEVPVVDRLGASPAFTENAKEQYISLIRQNYNHPSIFFWSAGNEVDPDGGNFNRQGPAVYDWFRTQNALGKKEDPTRLTASAWREKYFPPADVSDVFGLNEYLGWYTGDAKSGWEGLEKYVADHSDPAKEGVKGHWAVTEYGAGASVYFHSEKPVRMDHTEEYQALLHENSWKVFKAHPEIWGAFIWNMFDFAVDGRFEGERAGVNDKGMVTQDRKVKKDAFYFYKASWAQDPMIWLASKRFSTRGKEQIAIKAYSNLPKLALTVNGMPLGEKNTENATVVWEGVTLKEGVNYVMASGLTPDGRRIEDSATWTYKPGAPPEVYEGQDEIMKRALLTSPPRPGRPAQPTGRGGATRTATQPGTP